MSTKARVQAPGTRTGNLIADSAMGLVPETLPHHLNLTVAIWDAGPLGAADIELARLRNARHVGCMMCQAVRYDVAVEDGLAEEQVSLIDDEYLDSELSDRQKLILQFVDLYALDPRPPQASFQISLDAHFSAAEQVHLALALAYFNGSSRCAVALGGMPDSMSRMEIAVPR